MDERAVQDVVKAEREHDVRIHYSGQQEAVLYALRRAGLAGMTSWELTHATSCLKVSTRVSELRRMGVDIAVAREGVSRNHGLIFRYTLKEI